MTRAEADPAVGVKMTGYHLTGDECIAAVMIVATICVTIILCCTARAAGKSAPDCPDKEGFGDFD